MREALRKTAARGAQAIAGLLQRNGRRIVLLFLGVLLPLWIFAELADEVHELERIVFDDPLLLGAHAWAGPRMDRFFAAVSTAGYEGVVAVDVAVVLAIMLTKR